MSQAEDEYIDYSCSTPLERLARDIETTLRSWHVSQNDRHVSFSSPTSEQESNNQHPGNNVKHGPTPSNLSSRRNTHSSARSRLKARMNSSGDNSNSKASRVSLIRSKEIIMSTFEKETLHLCLSLWDAPSYSNTNTAISTTNSQSLPLSLQANWKSASSQPLTSLKSYCFSDLSSLYGIGQHLVLTTTQTKELQTFSVSVEMMQMSLNIATQNSYCRIPAFALPGEYQPIVMDARDSNAAKFGSDSSTNLFLGPPPLIHIPRWLVPQEIVNSTNMDAWTTSMGEQFQSSFSNNKNATAKPTSRFGGLFGRRTSSVRPSTISTALIPYDIDDPDHPDNQPWKKRECFKSIFKGYCNPGPNFQDIGASFVLEYIPTFIPAHLQTVEDFARLLRHICYLQFHSEKDGHGAAVDPSMVLSSYISNYHASDNASNHSQSQSSSFFSSSHPNHYTNDTQSSIPEDPNSISNYTRWKDKIQLEYASYKYEWNKKNILQRQASLTTIYDQNDYYNPYEWRESCISNTDIDLDIEEVFDRQDSYYTQCMHHAMTLLRATHISLKESQEERMEPMWGPSLDPLASIHLSLSWIRPNPPTPSATTTTASRLFSPRATNVDNHEDASDPDPSPGYVRKKEPPLFSPTQNPPSSFFTKCYWDRSLPCHTLSASTRCTLAAYLRASILHRDLLLCQLSNISVLTELSKHDDLEDIDDDDPNDHRKMDGVGMEDRAMELSNAALGNVVTKKLVKAMDFREAVKDLPEKTEMEERVKSILDGKLFPTWQQWITPDVEDHDEEEEGEEFIEEGMKVEDSCGKQDFLGLTSLNCAAPPGRLMSLLALHMAQMQTPTRMAALWQVFMEELRIRWEMRETLPLLHPIKGFDYFKDPSRSNMTFGVRTKANLAAFNHNTEPDPHQNYCLISQKLQVRVLLDLWICFFFKLCYSNT